MPLESRDKSILVIGGGVAGLSTALNLAGLGVKVDLVEKSHFPGGHAIRYTCKAADACVKCGACLVEEKLASVLAHPAITLHTGSEIVDMTPGRDLSAVIEKRGGHIDKDKCTNCGVCFDKCPVGAIAKGSCAFHTPFYAIDAPHCLFMRDRSCTLCQEGCPEEAIDLDQKQTTLTLSADAAVIAAGFQAFDPTDKPYGYGVFPGVVTNLELEAALRSGDALKHLANGKTPKRIAFIQCVGSRDAKANHLWCSKACCASALRMARLIRKKNPEMEITIFYMDIQTFGKDFERFYASVRRQVRFIRAIPGDICQSEDDRLRVTYFDQISRTGKAQMVDLAVLSVGMTPGADTERLCDFFKIKPAATGFFKEIPPQPAGDNLFVTGAATGPMTIADTIAHAGQTAWDVLTYFNQRRG
jgi:heterodisulfide reductase subunit A